ncbi:MAG: 16S rRNA (cytosine(1402)-N(4))-methyltransferase RsmH, partial [Lachnospiraceae bacterium]|nr:16S rRNA (cytosine(1402)-N(4))-methyltransferase RsmH [Lachnospiraceae bacterium]
AAELLERADADTIAEILRSYGEERFARQIAMRIVKVRETSPVRTTGELVSIIEKTIPQRFREKGGHVAKRTFQALRIAVNDELSGLSDTISGMIDHLSDGGRIAVITFHSLEDRIVKTAFHTAEDPCICPPDFPVCACGRKPKGIVITRKPVTASEEELADNSRAKSAKLRVFERHCEQI